MSLFLDSPFRTAISGAILKLQEEGKLHILKTRWWKEKKGGGACRVSDEKFVAHLIDEKKSQIFIYLTDFRTKRRRRVAQQTNWV